MARVSNAVEEAISAVKRLTMPPAIADAIEQLLRHHANEPETPHDSDWPTAPVAPLAPKPRNIGALAEIFHRRALRRVELLGDLASDYAWQMLLALTAEEGRGRALSVSAVCLASGARPTTALRHVSAMEAQGLVQRVGDPRDGRRSLIVMTEQTRTLVHKMLIDFCVAIPDEAPEPPPRLFAS